MPKYRKEISKLFGDNFIDAIKKLIKKGSLTKENIKDIADCMEVREAFDKHNDKGFDLIYIFECLLDSWYTNFRSPPTPADAQEKFLSFLRENHCVPYVITEVAKAFQITKESVSGQGSSDSGGVTSDYNKNNKI